VAESPSAPVPLRAEERELVEALRAGDERAFNDLIERYHRSMVRVARFYVRDDEVAEEVAQEAWEGVLRAIDRFEGRSSLRTWIFRILTNTAKTRAQREGRSVPMSALGEPTEDEGPAVGPERFMDGGGWASSPERWWEAPEARTLDREAREKILETIDSLPESQRAVITLRDVHGLDGQEVAEMLGVTDGNQRVLLHRARAKVREALEEYLSAES
jgi:RNA polymerase sigma-70 factor, ECF subfamily